MRRAFLAAALVATIVYAAPSSLNNALVLDAREEAVFELTTQRYVGAMQFGIDAGVPYWNPGDGGRWQPFGPVFHGNVPAQAIETGSGAPTVGVLVVTFANAFGVAPVCTCSDGSGGATAGCNHGACTTTGCTFTTVGTSTALDWICVGNK